MVEDPALGATIDLLIERSASGGPWMGHWIGGMGCCWIDPDRRTLIRRAAAETSRYAAWRSAWQPGFRPAVGEVRVLEEVETGGGAVGVSGSPMALFARDRAPVAAADVQDAFAVADRAWSDVERRISLLSAVQRSARPSAGKRTIEETFEHLGNCFWWYCSRVDDELAEWPDAGLTQEERARSFLRLARQWCMARAVAGASDAFLKTPARYRTDDPGEQWTLSKVIRRQAEHLWEHLATVDRDVALLL